MSAVHNLRKTIAALRAPGPKLDADDVRELDQLMARLEKRLRELGRAA